MISELTVFILAIICLALSLVFTTISDRRLKSAKDTLEKCKAKLKEIKDNELCIGDIPTSERPEFILCAAVKRKEPREKKCLSYKHPSCWDKYGKEDDINYIEIGRRHDLMHMYEKGVLDTSDQGFYTSYGRYVSREEAFLIAMHTGQCSTDFLSQGSTSVTLFSEDLY